VAVRFVDRRLARILQSGVSARRERHTTAEDLGMEHLASTRTAPLALAALALGLVLQPAPAQACGGFFCGQQPVDQTAERILFEVGADSVTMTTQISFNGDAADFAWVLPLSEVPLEGSLAVFRQQALNALDANSGPIFQPASDPECLSCQGCSAPPTFAEDADTGSSVTVYVRQEVGEYDVAVIASDDPLALVDWLRTEGYRITPAMEPYIERYTEEGLKFLALRLLVTADVQDLSPFRFSLPGTAPSIPLRMTALAAEPEMSIVAFVLADTRFEGKNWPNLKIADDQIRYNPFNSSISTNWARLVAQAVDVAGGQGWVTEFAGPSASYADQVRAQVENASFATPEDAEAAEQLLGALSAHPYLTRLYTRLSAEEMTVDPVLGRSSEGDVNRLHQLSRFVNGIDQCSEDQRVSSDPCDFATCGAGGLCRTVLVPGEATNGSSVSVAEAGCACLPGATARVTVAPDGSSTVICQDGRMSFLNAGDRDFETDEVLPDACAGFDCGENGRCTAVNMTPTCVCDQGFIAVGGVDAGGARRLSCVEPDTEVPKAFYAASLPELPLDLPGGREVPRAPSAAFPMPRETPEAASSAGGGACTLGAERGQALAPWAAALLIGLSCARRRRRP
jgi:hypothetical protein